VLQLTMAESSGKERYTFFYSNNSPFSQWYPANFTVDDIEYNCCEQYMMHKKAVLFADHEMAERIMATTDPRKQKELGRKVSNFDPDLWTENCREIVKTGNKAKFAQNVELKKVLFATEGTILVEASPRDRIWGIGLGEKNPKALNKTTWRGKNWLGYALTDVRKELMDEESP